MVRQFRVHASIVVMALIVTAVADDSALSWSGAPQMLHGNTTVRMVSEKVVIHAGHEGAKADCTFVFHNDGPACDIRIGFPDRATGAYFEDFIAKDGPNPHPTFQELKNFKSWVDGVPIKTKVTLAQDASKGDYGASWHEKVVHFPANQTVTIRDTYTQPESGGILPSNMYLNIVEYVMSTGASWKGNIGSAEVDVHYPGVKEALPYTGGAPEKALAFAGWKQLKPGQVMYCGFANPQVENGTLIFKRANFKPTKESDIYVFSTKPMSNGG